MYIRSAILLRVAEVFEFLLTKRRESSSNSNEFSRKKIRRKSFCQRFCQQQFSLRLRISLLGRGKKREIECAKWQFHNVYNNVPYASSKTSIFSSLLSLVSVEGRGGGRKVNLWGQTRVGGWLEARDPILANARETLCISPAHIDTLIPRETEVWWQNICRSNRRSRSCESPRVVTRRSASRFRSLHRIKWHRPRDLPQRPAPPTFSPYFYVLATTRSSIKCTISRNKSIFFPLDPIEKQGDERRRYLELTHVLVFPFSIPTQRVTQRSQPTGKILRRSLI